MSFLKSFEMISSSRGSNEIHLSVTRDCSEMNFLGIDSTRFKDSFCGRLTQVFCDSSVYTRAISTPVNLRNNDPDEPKPGDDRKRKEEIKETGHRSTPPVERARAMPVPLRHRGKNRANEGRLTEKRQDERCRDALGERVRYSNGRFSPLVRLWLQDLTEGDG